ncbi:MAG: hypothetical protein ACK5HL_00030 [Bacilli bacterium]
MPKIVIASIIVEILDFIAWIFSSDFDYSYVFLLSGFVYYFVNFNRYRNNSARHKHELETKNKMSNVTGTDRLVKRRTGLSSSKMSGANNKSVDRQNASNKFFEQFSEDS